MKIPTASLIGAFFVALGLLSPAPSQAYVAQPWCTDPRGYNSAGAPVCAYQSYAQCQKNAGFCVFNPAVTFYSKPPKALLGHI
jgi:hypothetical protein